MIDDARCDPPLPGGFAFIIERGICDKARAQIVEVLPLDRVEALHTLAADDGFELREHAGTATAPAMVFAHEARTLDASEHDAPESAQDAMPESHWASPKTTASLSAAHVKNTAIVMSVARRRTSCKHDGGRGGRTSLVRLTTRSYPDPLTFADPIWLDGEEPRSHASRRSVPGWSRCTCA